ncbi:MAG: LIC_12616 family protein [Halanaerobiales bacterium]
MIDTKQFLKDLWSPLNTIFSGNLQILLADQEVPTGKLDKNRVIYNMISMPGNYARQSIQQSDEAVESTSEDFENDIMRTSVLYPDATISFNGFGPVAIDNLQQIREWFNIPNRGDIWLHEEWGCSIRDITEVQNRTAFLETDFEKRYGFDVILNFKDVIEDRLDTIEQVEGTFNGIPYKEEL